MSEVGTVGQEEAVSRTNRWRQRGFAARLSLNDRLGEMTMTRKAFCLLGGLFVLIGVGAFCLLYTSVGRTYARRGLYGIIWRGMSRSHVEALLGGPSYLYAQPDTIYYWPLRPHRDPRVSPKFCIVRPVCIVYSNNCVRSKRWLPPDEVEQENSRILGR